jgi:signal transduction histidine kinase
LELLLPLAVSAVFSAILSIRLLDWYAENFETLDREVVPAAVFKAHLPLLLGGGGGLLCLLTLLVGGLHWSLRRALTAALGRPLEDLGRGMEKLRENRGDFRLEVPPGIFGPLYEAFNQAACALRVPEARAPPAPKPPSPKPLDRLRDGLDEIAGVLDRLPQGQRNYLDTVEAELRPLRVLVNEVLLLLALDRGEFLMEGGALELGRFLEDFTAAEAPDRSLGGLRLSLLEPREEVWINADGNWLRDALRRILDHFMQGPRLERGRAVIRCRLRRGPPPLAELVLSGSRPAPGEAALPLLFERPGFFQDPAAQTLPPGESSLNLALAGRIVKNLGGSVYAEPGPWGGLQTVLLLPEARQRREGGALSRGFSFS